jgi:hypothetical protein
MSTRSLHGDETHIIRPLPFSIANEGRPNTSAFALFQLPEELFPLVIRYLDENELSSLALVDCACLQLVRARRFYHVRLLFIDDRVTKEILSTLLEESRIREENQGSISRSSLGSCVRRITVGFKGMELAQKSTAWVDEITYETRASQVSGVQYYHKCQTSLTTFLIAH